MRWFERSVVIGVLMLVLTPAPAHAWFEFLDYLSGPGPFYGAKVDLRVWCAGTPLPLRELEAAVRNSVLATQRARSSAEATTARTEWTNVVDQLAKSDQELRLFTEAEFKDLKGELDQAFDRAIKRGDVELGRDGIPRSDILPALQRIHAAVNRMRTAAVSVASTGIFISLCSPEKLRSFAVELGFTTLQANSNPDYANDYTIRLNTFTGAVSYRLPLPADRDFIDAGLIAGMYRFSSRGFTRFSGLTVEPFVDFHGPTRLAAGSGLKQLAGLLTLRLGLVFFPGGFDGEQFASAPTKPTRISGREATPSATIFFNLSPLLQRRTPTTF